MKVLHLNLQITWGGGENQSLLLMRALAGHGVRNHLLCRPGGVLERRLREALPDAVVHHLPASLWLLLTLRRHTARLQAELGFDVIHSHTGREMRGLGAVTDAVTVAHRRVPDPVSRAALRGYSGVQGVIAVSAEIARRLAGQGLKGPEVRVIHSAVDTEEAASGREDLPGQPAFLYLGRLLRHKGLDGLLRAHVQLLTRVPGAVLHLVGEGPDEQRLKSLAGKLLPASAVVFHGFRTNPRDFIAGAHALILASRDEGLGTVVLQAQFQACPAVVSDAGGLPETIRDGVTGLLVPAGDVPALAAALERLALEPGLREQLAAAGPEHIRQHFSLAALGQQTLDFYRELHARLPGR